MRGLRGAPVVLPAILIVFLTAPLAAAQGYQAETVELAPPEELAAEVRQELSSKAVRVTGPEGPLCEIWLRAAVPTKAAGAAFGVIYGQVAEGTLVGAVRFLAEHGDYRRQRITPGVYTLRYALHPVDGNHLGVSPQRDFLLLLPAGRDTALASLDTAALNDLSARAAGTTHPSVWSLLPAEEGEPPAISHHSGEDHWVLTLRLTIQVEGGTEQPLPLSLVIAGHAAEA